MRWFQALMPREDRFFEIYIQHAQLLVQGAQALRVVHAGGPNVETAVKHVFALKAQADGIARDVFTLVQKSFITPFERGDIKDLINTLDDAIDQMKKTAKAMTELIEQAAVLTLEALFLRHRRATPCFTSRASRFLVILKK